MTHRPQPIRPLLQGQLDGLCGCYAIINAIRLVLRPGGIRFSESDCRELFYALMLEADETVGAIHATACGIDTKPFCKILKAAERHLRDEHEIGICAAPLLGLKERPPVTRTLAKIGHTVRQPGSTVIASFEGRLDHWTVIRRVSDQWLELFDSSVFSRLSVGHCRMSYESRSRNGTEHIIHPRSIFRLSLKPNE